MPISLLELARESFFRPRTAAPYLIGVNLSRNTLIEAAMLLAVLTVLSQYLMFWFAQNYAPDILMVNFSVPIIDVAIQFAGVFLASQIVVIFARGIGRDVSIADSVTVYLWFNFLLVVLLTVIILASVVFGAAAMILILFMLFWGPYTLAVFWSELLGTSNRFLGFVVAVVAFLMTSAISVVVSSILGLPVMEIIPNA